MGIATDLLIGSARINQCRQEIKALVTTVLGFLKDTNYLTGTALIDNAVLFEDDHHRWTFSYSRASGSRVCLYRRRGDVETLIYDYPNGGISLQNARIIRYNLDTFAQGMRDIFPALHAPFRHLIAAGKDEFHIYYEIRFKSKDGRKMLRFEKKSNLRFPLPLETESHFGLEGEPSTYRLVDGMKIPEDGSGACFFKAVGYEHGATDEFGHLHSEKFSVILEPDEAGLDPLDQNFPHLLKVNGWEELDPFDI